MTNSTTMASGTDQIGRPEVSLKPLLSKCFRMYGMAGSVAAATTIAQQASTRAAPLLSRK